MKKFIKISLIILAVILLIIAGIVGYAYFSTRNARSGTLKLQGLTAPVTITRDQWGVPHIVSEKSDLDVYFALGYVQAQDRLWQMEFQRRVTQGTLSEVLGKAALDKDIFLRTWGFYRATKSEWGVLDQSTKDILIAYTAGVNAFLKTGRLPLQFKILGYKPKPWAPIDSLSWGKMMSFNLQNYWTRKINNYVLAKKYGKNQLDVIRPAYPNNHPTILNSSIFLASAKPEITGPCLLILISNA